LLQIAPPGRCACVPIGGQTLGYNRAGFAGRDEGLAPAQRGEEATDAGSDGHYPQ
jgi:hypothetical protein